MNATHRPQATSQKRHRAVLAGCLVLAVCCKLWATGWPLTPQNAAHPLGNDWGEFQDYGTGSYFHNGIDCFPDTIGQGAHAVAKGWVKAWGTTQQDYHYRLAISDSTMSHTERTTGWLYAHIDATRWHKNVGDSVAEGELIGYLVPWPVTGFDHTHFARISDTGATWSRFPNPTWQFIQNPLTIIQPVVDTTRPTFENARGSHPFAFCRNNTSTYFSAAADTLKGDIDVIARIYDRINPYTDSSTWNRLAPQTITWAISGRYKSLPETLGMTVKYIEPPIGASEINVVYKDDNTCNSYGDYSTRTYYFIVTNTDGDSVIEMADTSGCWHTATWPDTSYWFKVTAYDASGNSTSDSQQVTTLNNIKNVGCSRLIAPSGTLDSGTAVTPACSVYNYGTTFASYNVRMKIGTGYNQTLAITRHVPGQYLYLTFPSWTASPLGSIAVTCSTEYTGDIQTGNDKRIGSVVVQGQGVHDVACLQIIAPAGSVDSGAVIVPRGVVSNLGTASENFYVRFSIGGSYSDSEPLTLPAGALDTVSFAAWTASPLGELTTRCSTLLASDANSGNDRAMDSVLVSPLSLVEEKQSGVPHSFSLENPNPNPGPGMTRIRYALQHTARVELSIYSATGELVQEVFNGRQRAGNYSLLIAPGALPDGVYYCRLAADEFRAVRKLVLTK